MGYFKSDFGVQLFHEEGDNYSKQGGILFHTTTLLSELLQLAKFSWIFTEVFLETFSEIFYIIKTSHISYL